LAVSAAAIVVGGRNSGALTATSGAASATGGTGGNGGAGGSVTPFLGRSARSIVNRRIIPALAADTDLWTDPVWLVDSTPVECARSRPTVRRS